MKACQDTHDRRPRADPSRAERARPKARAPARPTTSPRAGSTGSRAVSSSVSIEGWITFVIVVGSVVFTLAQLHPNLLFSNTTPTGGDMGAHVWGPAYLRDHILPHWRLSGWAPDWYAGFPMYQFYMVIPALAVVLVNILLPYGLALKLVVDLRRALAPDRSVGLRQAERPSLPAAGDVLGDVGDLPLRRELHDLRRQHRIDDGGRVLVLDRAVARVRLLRSARPRAAHGQAPRARGRAAGAVRALPPDRGDLRGDGHRRVVPALPRPSPLQVARDDGASRARCSPRSGSCRSSCAATTSPTWGTNGAPTT